MHVGADHLLVSTDSLRIELLVAVQVTTRHVVGRLQADSAPIVDDRWRDQALQGVAIDGGLEQGGVVAITRPSISQHRGVDAEDQEVGGERKQDETGNTRK